MLPINPLVLSCQSSFGELGENLTVTSDSPILIVLVHRFNLLIPNFFLGILWYNNSTKLTFLIILQIFIYMFAYLKLSKKYS